MEWFDEFCGFSGRPQGCCASLRDNALDPAHQIRKQKSYSISKQMLRFGVEPGKPFEIVWDGQVWDLDLWVIPKGAKNKKAAMEFLSFSTATEQLAAQASYISYGPVRKSSAPLVGKYYGTNIDMEPQMPTAPSNLSNAVQSNFEFWADNEDRLTQRFNDWLVGINNLYSIDTCQSDDKCSVMPVFFGTNRDQTNGNDRIRFGKLDARSLKLGVATVAIPKRRKRGQEVNDVSWSDWISKRVANIFNSKTEDDPTKLFVIPDNGIIVFSNADEFVKSVEKYRNINQFQNEHSFVFIHGYNTSFDEAAFRTAQLAYDLGLSGSSFGVPFFFSWPSAGSGDEYVADYDNARYAEDELNDFLKLVVDKTKSKYVHIVAHSMGNYLFLEMLVNPNYKWGEKRKLNEVVLAAPDIDARRFIEMSPFLANKADKFTLYASDMDDALGWSEFLRRGKPRAGDVKSGVPVTTNEIETIDVSALGYESFHAFSGAHSNYAETLDLIDDIAVIFQHNQHPPHDRKRSFIPVRKNQIIFWRLQK